jgi:signal recognition particle subunit SRP54
MGGFPGLPSFGGPSPADGLTKMKPLSVQEKNAKKASRKREKDARKKSRK